MEPAEAVERVHEQAGHDGGMQSGPPWSPLAMAISVPDDEFPGAPSGRRGWTHQHPLAGDVAAAVAVLCRQFIRGEPWYDALATAKIGRLQPTIEALDVDHPCPLSPGGYAPDVLRAAVHFVASHDAIADALNDSLDFAGPANYCPVLVGAMAGARWRAAAIPVQMLLDCDLLGRIQDVSHRLADEWEEVE